MSDEVLEKLVSSYMSTGQRQYQFGWQGGEPTLLGREFFQKAVGFQQEYGRAGSIVANGIQTNGVLIDKAMAKLFAGYNFLAGVSLDGPPAIHNRFRKYPDGRPTHSQVVRGMETLRESRVEFNSLTLVNSENVKRPGGVYRYLRDSGIMHHQYIPCVEFDEKGELRPYAITGRQWGMFLCGIFDEWFKTDTRTVSVRLFDSILNLMVRGVRTVCHMEDNCCQYFVVEYNGDVYPCDFFVDEDKKLGSIMENSWEELLASAKYADFGEQKSRWNRKCAGCGYLDYCMGDCLKHRFVMDKNPENLSWLCSGWEMFFSHSLPRFREIAALLLKHARNPGRNDPCPCGSGKKYKHCHINRSFSFKTR